jgi:hypothetical protein
VSDKNRKEKLKYQDNHNFSGLKNKSNRELGIKDYKKGLISKNSPNLSKKTKYPDNIQFSNSDRKIRANSLNATTSKFGIKQK